MGVDATACQSPFLLSSRYLPYCQRLPLTAHSAGNFSQRANLSLKVCSQSRPAAWRSAPPVRARSPFSGTWLPDSSKQTNYGRTLLPTRLKIANLDRSTPGGNPPITRKKGLYGQRMSSRHAQRTPLPVARHARQLFLLLPRTPQHPARPREARIEMPEPARQQRHFRSSSTEPCRPLPPGTSVPPRRSPPLRDPDVLRPGATDPILQP